MFDFNDCRQKDLTLKEQYPQTVNSYITDDLITMLLRYKTHAFVNQYLRK